MKKILRISTMLLLVVFLSLGFAGCKPTIEKINVDLDTIKTEYFVGETQETYENAEVFCVYSNGDLKAIEDKENITFSSISTTEVGTQTLTVTYKGKTQEITITVREKEVTAISVTGLKTAYVLGEAQNNACTVTATFEDNTTAVIPTSEVTFTTISTDEIGTQTITVTYKGVSQNITVYVNEKAIERIEVDEETLFLTNIYYGDIFADDERCCNIVAFVYYADETSDPLSFDDLTFSDVNTTPEDLTVPQTLTISYKGVSTTVDVTILERLIESIEIVETDLKLNYDLGETVDAYTNLKINILYNNGTSDEGVLVSSLTGAVVTKPTIDTIGTKTLKVAYKGFEDTATVSVTEKEVKTVNLAISDSDYIKGDSYQENVTITLTYTDDTTRTLTSVDATFADVNFGSFDISKSGYQTLTATYGGQTSNSVEITVYSSIYDSYYITYAAPSFVGTFNTNSAKDSTKFKVSNKTYVVGDENNFVFFPKISAFASFDELINPEAQGTPLTSYKLSFKVEERDNKASNYKLLEGLSLSEKVSIDDEKGLLNFSDSAVGKQYRISVTPYFTTINGNDKKQAITFEFEVQKGYNVYNAEELSLFDNYNNKVFDSDTTGVWTDFKNEKGFNFNVSGLFLHTNINITSDNYKTILPSGYFHKAGAPTTPSAEAVGSLVDYEYLYMRKVDSGTFTFNGNYFQINVSGLPLISYFGSDNSEKLAHSSLFYTLGEGKVVFENIDFFGNALRGESELLSGGIILAKVSGENGKANETTFENVITKAFFTSFFSQYGATMNMNNCIASDNFSCILYSWGKNVNNVNNCSLTRCGGPIAIITHEDPETNPHDRYGELNIDKDSYLHNPVTFQEGWFTMVGASDLVTVFPQLDYLLKTSSLNYKTIVDEKGMCNLIAVVLNGTDPKASSSVPVQGKVDFNGSILDMTHSQDNAIYAGIIANSNAYGLEQPPIFQAGGQTYYTDAQTGIYDATQQLITAQKHPEFFSDDYVGISLPTGGTQGRLGVLVRFYGELPTPEEE